MVFIVFNIFADCVLLAQPCQEDGHVVVVVQELGLHFKRPDIYQLIGEHDANGEGRIQAREFRGIMVEGARPSDLEPAQFDLMWTEFDRGKVGYV